MPRPQFTIRALLVAMLIVAAFAWTWANMEPIPHAERALELIGIAVCFALFALMVVVMARESKRKSERRQRCP